MNSNYDTNNIFAKILRKKLPCIPVYEDENTLSFMDIMPQVEGHVLVIPKEPAETILELSDTAACALINTVQKVSKAVKDAMQAQGITLVQYNGAEAGQTVPHVHFHILPGSLNQAKRHASEMADQAQLKALAESIIAHLAQ